MAINLSKGQKVNLRKEAPNLKRVLVGLGWDPVGHEVPKTSNEPESKAVRFFKSLFGVNSNPNPDSYVQRSQPDIDIDGSIIVINKDGCKEEVVYYGNLGYHNNAIKHYGDNLTGEGEEGADDEQIEIKLDEIPKRIQKLSIIINIYSALQRNQTFDQVKNCYVHVTDMDTGKELLRYDIDDSFEGMTGIFVADLERCDNDWHFKAIGDGVKVRNIEEMVEMKCRR